MAGPVIDSFDPTWVLVSAGYDAHAPIRWLTFVSRAETSPCWRAAGERLRASARSRRHVP